MAENGEQLRAQAVELGMAAAAGAIHFREQSLRHDAYAIVAPSGRRSDVR